MVDGVRGHPEPLDEEMYYELGVGDVLEIDFVEPFDAGH